MHLIGGKQNVDHIDQAPPSDADLLRRAREVVIAQQTPSVSLLQRHLRLGWTRCNALMTQLEGELVSSPLYGGGRIALPAVLDITHTAHPLNTYWLVPQALLAGEYPGATDPELTRRKVADFLALGFNAFLDLTEAHELSPYEAVLHELSQDKGIDCVYRRMPIRDVDVPKTPMQMGAILDQLHNWRMHGRKTYFHCWGGVGRTGTVAGCYLIEHGHYTGEAALAQLQLLWTHMTADKQRRKPHTPETQAQRDYVLNWAQRNTNGDKGDAHNELV